MQNIAARHVWLTPASKLAAMEGNPRRAELLKWRLVLKVSGPKQVSEITQRNGESPFLKERSLRTDPLV